MVNLNIVQSCEKICDKPLIQILVTSAVPLIDMETALDSYRRAVVREIMKLYNGIIDMIIVCYDGFEPQMDSVSYCLCYL